MDDRIENARPSEIERPGRVGVGDTAPLVGGLHASIRRHHHPGDPATQLIENCEFADAPRDELELLAIFAIERVLDRRQLEEKFLETAVEQNGS